MNRKTYLAALGASAAFGVIASGAAVSRGKGPLFGTADSVASVSSTRSSAPVVAAMHGYVADTYRADSALARLVTRAAAHDLTATRAAFLDARLAYKRLEFLAEHYTPLTAAALNGPAIDKPDDENPKIIVRPTGLQVIEGMLFGADAKARLDSVAIQARIAQVNVLRLRERAAETHVVDAQIFEAARLEVARIVSLGVSGFDTPLAGTAIPEAAESIRSIARALSPFAARSPTSDSLQHVALNAERYLDVRSGVEDGLGTFDHFEFVSHFLNPLARQIGALQDAANIQRLVDARALTATANTVFDSGAFNAYAFGPPGTRQYSPALVALGGRLFTETRLSGSNDRNCASCHEPSHAFSDGRRVPLLLSGNATPATSPRRNTPTLYNAALQATSFADARVAFLEDQIKVVVNNPQEMGGDIETAAAILYDDISYREDFVRAFGALPERAMLSRELRSALAAYVRSLVRMDSRFDRAMRGDTAAVSAEERRGFNVFMGKGRCGSCHFAPLFNGTTPPGYAESEVEVIGVPASAVRGTGLDTDRGVGAADKAPLHDYAFKTPTVRNAAVTGPYMHNGAYRTLAEVIDFYDAGGGVGLGLRVPNQTLSADSLHLSASEKHDLIAFLGALTDTSATEHRR